MSALGDIARWSMNLPWLTGQERSVLSHMADCKTEHLGGNVLSCECGHREVHYNSCRDRHCPLCQGAARARWVQARLGELLPCAYFHVVFTVPHELISLTRSNRHAVYRALFLSVHETLSTVCAAPDSLGARVGGLSILHTWNQKLAFHPHIHCIVPGGGISKDRSRWISSRPSYLVPVKRLSAVFRGIFLGRLEHAIRTKTLCGIESVLHDALRKAARKPFVVYAKPPFGGPSQVVKYLGRYTHRVGIHEKRILHASKDRVSFSWIDRTAGNATKVMHLSCDAFIRKFILHILPKGFRKIRYFGFMGNRNRSMSFAQVRRLIADSDSIRGEPEHGSSHKGPGTDLSSEPHVRTCCPLCGQPLRIRHEIGIQTSGLQGSASRHVVRGNSHGPEPNAVASA